MDAGRFIHRANIALFFIPLVVCVTLALIIAAPLSAVGMVFKGARRHWND